MQQVFDCLTGAHDFRLVALAGVICFLASLTAVNLVGRARDGHNARSRLGWLATAAIATGFGIWSTHFIAMLAYQPGLPMGYDVALTVASAIIAIVVTGFGIAVYTAGRTWAPAAMGGGVVGAGIACMHYVGMAAVIVPGRIEFDYQIVASSVVLGIGLGALAFSLSDRWRNAFGVLLASVVLTASICCMHFAAMGAVTVIPDVNAMMPSNLLSDEWLAAGIAAATATLTVLCLVSSLVDRHLVKRTLDESARLTTLANASTEGIVICVADRIEYGNIAFLGMTGATVADLSGDSLLSFIDPEVYEQILAALAGVNATAFETTLCTRSGERVPVQLLPRRLHVGPRRDRIVLVARDLTEQKRNQARIEYLAHHDSLTGLANRVRFNDRLDHDLARASRAGEQLGVLCIDLDRFKQVNDSHGHGVGDELLTSAAARLETSVRGTDTVARLSGDEFAILQVGSQQPEGARHLASRIIEVLAEPFALQGSSVVIGASIGIAIYPDDGVRSDTLLRQADTALYRAKSDGRNTFRFFEPDMDRAMRQRRELEADLRQAIGNDELHLEYQPLADTQTRQTVGFEALVRWNHPLRGMLPPGQFINLAEESGLIVDIGDWVLRRACRDAATWRLPLKVAVNLSPVQFQRGDLAAEIDTVLREIGLQPNRLELEITEGVLLEDQQRAIATLTAIKALGVSIAMDDFGTGYSSLSYLQSFPFDKIKIDRSFVAGLQENDDARAIVKAVIGLSHALNLPMVAEGVEDEFQLEFLRRERCTEVQGYLIGRPAPIESYDALLHPQEPVRNLA